MLFSLKNLYFKLFRLNFLFFLIDFAHSENDVQIIRKMIPPFIEGDFLNIKGLVTDSSTEGFSMALQEQDATMEKGRIFLHFKPKFNYEYTELSSHIDGHWNYTKIIPIVTKRNGESFNLTFYSKPNVFQVQSENGKRYSYPHNLNPGNAITLIGIYGPVTNIEINRGIDNEIIDEPSPEVNPSPPGEKKANKKPSIGRSFKAAKAPVKAPVKAKAKAAVKAPAKAKAKPAYKAPVKAKAKPAYKAPVKSKAKPAYKAPAKKPAYKAPAKSKYKAPAKSSYKSPSKKTYNNIPLNANAQKAKGKDADMIGVPMSAVGDDFSDLIITPMGK